MKTPDCTRYLLFTVNLFVIGESLPIAAEKLLNAGAKRSDKIVGYLLLDDPNPKIDCYGDISIEGIYAPDAMLIRLGKLGKVGDLTA